MNIYVCVAILHRKEHYFALTNAEDSLRAARVSLVLSGLPGRDNFTVRG